MSCEECWRCDADSEVIPAACKKIVAIMNPMQYLMPDGGCGDFGTMGVSMKKGEEADDGGADRERQPDGSGDEDAQHKDGDRDSSVRRKGSRQPDIPSEGAEGHDEDEGKRDEPDRAATAPGSPEADGEHCQ